MFELASCGDAWQDAATDTNDPERRQQKPMTFRWKTTWVAKKHGKMMCGHHLNAMFRYKAQSFLLVLRPLTTSRYHHVNHRTKPSYTIANLELCSPT